MTPNNGHSEGYAGIPVLTHSRSTGHRQQGEERRNDLWFVAMTVLAAIASDSVLDAAFAWLCTRRRDYPDHADVWEFRRNWLQEKDRIRVELSSGRYRFGLLDRVALANGDEIDLWSARVALGCTRP